MYKEILNTCVNVRLCKHIVIIVVSLITPSFGCGFGYIAILPKFGLDQLMNIIEGAVLGGTVLAGELEDNFCLVSFD